MNSRYSTSMGEIWSDHRRFGYWLDIEKQVVRGWERLGVIPKKDADLIWDKASFTIDEIHEYEARTHHDFAAFVDVITESVGEAGRWIHYGLTSSDVIDTALSLQIRDSIDLIGTRLTLLGVIVENLSIKHKETKMVGRTHGVHAEPMSFGAKLDLWVLEIERCYQRLMAARESISVGSISGTVGIHSTVSPEIERWTCITFGLKPTPAKQIINRDRHAEFIWVLASIATTLDSIATQIRLLAQTEIGEVKEGFTDSQKGSSAMPHKQNPVRCERISGLARLVRAYVPVALENVVTWNERDISHSSVERMMFPDSSGIVDFMLEEMCDIIKNLVVYPDKMRKNLELTDGLIYSHPLLLALIYSGLSRSEAYRLVQDASRESMETRVSLKYVALKNEAITKVLSYDDIETLFMGGGNDV